MTAMLCSSPDLCMTKPGSTFLARCIELVRLLWPGHGRDNPRGHSGPTWLLQARLHLHVPLSLSSGSKIGRGEPPPALCLTAHALAFSLPRARFLTSNHKLLSFGRSLASVLRFLLPFTASRVGSLRRGPRIASHRLTRQYRRTQRLRALHIASPSHLSSFAAADSATSTFFLPLQADSTLA
jgi:hypothetical protein